MDQDPTRTVRLLAEARRHFEQGRPDQAESILNTVLGADPRAKQALLALGIVASETGRRELAVDRIGQALEIDPYFSPALCCMSVLLLQSDKPEEARRCAERAVSSDPRNADTHAALARCLVKQKLHTEAISCFHRAVNLNPSDPKQIVELADALLAVRREREAAEALRRAVRLAPNPRALVNLAYLELRLGTIEDAEKYCLRALRHSPDLAPAQALMARILTERLDLEQAEVYWRRAEELEPKPESVLVEKALALSAIGRFDDAMHELRRSIELEPSQGAAYQALVYAKHIGPDDLQIVSQMERLVGQASLSQDDRLNLLYSLGKAYDNLGDYERAMDCFDRANGLKNELRGGRRFDREALRSLTDAKVELFSKTFFAGCRQGAFHSSLPILVVGMMRSGTTLVEQMLSCHPEIGGAGEQDYWREECASTVDLLSSAKLRAEAERYVELLKSVAPGLPHVIDKNPANVQVLGKIHAALPNSRIILTRRHAIDTALSIWMTPMSTTAEFVGDREDIVYAYKEHMRLTDHWREVLPANRLLEVRYEDLVSEPEVVAPRIVGFCGLKWDEACLHPEQNERRVRTPSQWQVRQPVYKSSIDRWQRYECRLGAFEELRGLA